MKNNLFDIATSELSQDAFFTWLISWADKSHRETLMNECGREFLNKVLLRNTVMRVSTKCKVEVARQYKSIDIFCQINDDIAIIIEDKVGSKEHSNQLRRYRQTIINDGYSPEKVICIYLKTHDQSDLSAVEKAHFAI